MGVLNQQENEEKEFLNFLELNEDQKQELVSFINSLREFENSELMLNKKFLGIYNELFNDYADSFEKKMSFLKSTYNKIYSLFENLHFPTFNDTFSKFEVNLIRPFSLDNVYKLQGENLFEHNFNMLGYDNINFDLSKSSELQKENYSIIKMLSSLFGVDSNVYKYIQEEMVDEKSRYYRNLTFKNSELMDIVKNCIFGTKFDYPINELPENYSLPKRLLYISIINSSNKSFQILKEYIENYFEEFQYIYYSDITFEAQKIKELLSLSEAFKINETKELFYFLNFLYNEILEIEEASNLQIRMINYMILNSKEMKRIVDSLFRIEYFKYKEEIKLIFEHLTKVLDDYSLSLYYETIRKNTSLDESVRYQKDFEEMYNMAITSKNKSHNKQPQNIKNINTQSIMAQFLLD